MSAEGPDAVLTEQLAYYEARAPEYDEWFLRQGRYDRGEAAAAAWRAELAAVRAQLASADWAGRHVLELAPGTGLWTEWLLGQGAGVSVVEGSPAMVRQLTDRVGAAALSEIIAADLFSWSPSRTYDAVFFGFFLSHVRRRDLSGFFRLVASALAPGGVVGFVDGRAEPASTAVDHVLPAPGEDTMQRRLNDGRTYQIVKVFYEPDELVRAASDAGLALAPRVTERYFLYGLGRR